MPMRKMARMDLVCRGIQIERCAVYYRKRTVLRNCVIDVAVMESNGQQGLAASQTVKIKTQWLGHGDGSICCCVVPDRAALPLDCQEVPPAQHGVHKLLCSGLERKQFFARPGKY